MEKLTGSEIIQGIAERLGKRVEDAARFSEHMTCPSANVIAHVVGLELASLARLVDVIDEVYPSIAGRVIALEALGETQAHAEWSRIAKMLNDARRECEAAARGRE